MSDGTEASYINLELGIARDLGKPVIAIAEDSAYLGPLLEKVPDLLVIELGAPEECAVGLFSLLSALKTEQRVIVALFWAVIATLGEIFASRE
jgi:hypothetical protein